MGTIEAIEQYDREYHEKCDNLKIAYECTEQGQTCWWPGCDAPKQSQGLCTKHFARFKKGNLLTCSFADYDTEERYDLADYILEFTQIAKAKGLTPEQLMERAVMTVLEMGRAFDEKNGEKNDG